MNMAEAVSVESDAESFGYIPRSGKLGYMADLFLVLFFFLGGGELPILISRVAVPFCTSTDSE